MTRVWVHSETHRLKPAPHEILKTRAARTERDVHDGFEVDRFAVFFRGAEFPLRESFHRIGIETRVHAVHQLDAVHAAVLADDRVEHDFSFHMHVAKLGRILRIHFPQGNGPARSDASAFRCVPPVSASSSSAKFRTQLPDALVRFGIFTCRCKPVLSPALLRAAHPIWNCLARNLRIRGCDFEPSGAIRARGTGRDGNALPAARDAEPMPARDRAGVRAVSAADEDAFRTAASPPPVASPLASPPDAVPPGVPAWVHPVKSKCAPKDFRRGSREAGAPARASRKARSACRYRLRARRFREPRRFASVFCGAARGADIGLTGSSGFGGACADEAMLIAPGLLFRRGNSGAAASEAGSDAGAFGRMAVSSLP